MSKAAVENGSKGASSLSAKAPASKMSEAVKVIVRCRPLNERENKLNCEVVIAMQEDRGFCSISKPGTKQPAKEFSFDGVYFVNSLTEQIYSDLGYPLVEGVVEGYNGTVFAYGQTGSGKSYTMQGVEQPPTQRGIIPRAFHHIFETVSVAENTKFLVHASYLEIYNEDVRDLLSKNIKDKLELKEHPDKGVYVRDLSKVSCSSVRECEKVMAQGWSNRSTGATLMNADSSRSHSIFTIYLEGCTTGKDGKGHIRAGKLNLVDLAGSERQAKTGATGDRLKEATKINLSLSALGNVISALVDGKSKHIPYRDSKLTRLLQDSLGGNTKTLMVACISPADNNYDETLSTLRYANRAKNIQNKPKINEDPKDALLREYQQEIQKLKDLLAQSGGAASVGAAPKGKADEDLKRAKAEKEEIEKRSKAEKEELEKLAKEEKEKTEKIEQEYQKKLEELKKHYEAEQMSNVKLQQDMKKLKSTYEQQMKKAKASAKAQKSPLASSTASSVSDPGYFESPLETPEAGKNVDSVAAPASIPTKPLSMAAEDYSKLSKEEIMKEHEEALKRLQMIQQNMVGGEKSTDEDAKKRVILKRRHADERKKRLAEAAKRDDDETMLDVYDSLSRDVQQRSKIIDKQKEKIYGLKMEIDDLNFEFERDRSEYLSAIRKQSQEIDLLKAMLFKIHPTLRRDCNYSNLDKIRSESKYDDELQRWILPDLVVTKTTLPSAVSNKSDSSRNSRSGKSASDYSNSSVESFHENYSQRRDEDRYLAKLSQSKNEEAVSSYFAPKRQVKHIISSSYNDNSRFSMNEDTGSSLHGGGGMLNEPVRRPIRLDALDPSSIKTKKNKKKQDVL